MSRADRWRAIITAKKQGGEITYNGDKVYVDGRCVYDPDSVDDQELYTDDEETRLWAYTSALDELAEEHQRYHSNYNLWQRWDKRMRLWWIGVVEKQAQDEKQTIGVDVVMRAVEIRLTRSRT